MVVSGAGSDVEEFCVVKWENSGNTTVVPHTTILQLFEDIHLYDVYSIDTAGSRQKGQIIFKGTLTVEKLIIL